MWQGTCLKTRFRRFLMFFVGPICLQQVRSELGDHCGKTAPSSKTEAIWLAFNSKISAKGTECYLKANIHSLSRVSFSHPLTLSRGHGIWWKCQPPICRILANPSLYVRNPCGCFGPMACRRNQSSIKSLIWFLNPQHAWQLWCGNLEMDQWWWLKLEHGKKTLNSCTKKMQTNTILHIGHGFCGSNDLDLFKVMLYLMHLYHMHTYVSNCQIGKYLLLFPTILNPRSLSTFDWFTIWFTTWFIVKVNRVTGVSLISSQQAIANTMDLPERLLPRVARRGFLFGGTK